MLAVALLTALMAVTIVTSNAQSASTPAHLATALKVDDTAHLHYVKESDAQLIDEGPAAGTLYTGQSASASTSERP